MARVEAMVGMNDPAPVPPAEPAEPAGINPLEGTTPAEPEPLMPLYALKCDGCGAASSSSLTRARGPGCGAPPVLRGGGGNRAGARASGSPRDRTDANGYPSASRRWTSTSPRSGKLPSVELHPVAGQLVSRTNTQNRGQLKELDALTRTGWNEGPSSREPEIRAQEAATREASRKATEVVQ